MKVLVGYTGFVGSNIVNQMKFDLLLNRKNVKDGYDKNPELLVYAGVTGTKFLANSNPTDDSKIIENAKKNIKGINPKKLVLISTVDVYDNLDNKDEDYEIKSQNIHTYGRNRYDLEKWVEKNFDDYHIIRLPAIYGNNLKKNFINDIINPIPKFLDSTTYYEIESDYTNISKYYTLNSGIHELCSVDLDIYNYFLNSKYNSLRFTDSNAVYQYFNLSYFGEYIKFVIDNEIKIINCVTEGISARELFQFVYSKDFNNTLSERPIIYNLKTKYQDKIDKNDFKFPYIKEDTLKEIKLFIITNKDNMERKILDVNSRGEQ